MERNTDMNMKTIKDIVWKNNKCMNSFLNNLNKASVFNAKQKYRLCRYNTQGQWVEDDFESFEEAVASILHEGLKEEDFKLVSFTTYPSLRENIRLWDFIRVFKDETWIVEAFKRAVSKTCFDSLFTQREVNVMTEFVYDTLHEDKYEEG
jgi:hypothetical protein